MSFFHYNRSFNLVFNLRNIWTLQNLGHRRARTFNADIYYNEGPQYVIRQKIMAGVIKSDDKQSAVIDSLQALYESIKHYSPRKLFSSRAPKGLYIYGSVGAGKTMLMDVFYETIKIESKRRVHFNNFMADVHSRIHKIRGKQKLSPNILIQKTKSFDPIKPVAKQLVSEAWLLCFDEFQVTDIADAMILKSIFTEMFNYGMVMVATSNRAPDDLYKNGLQRSHFLPFIPVLKQHCNIVTISGKDYRILIGGTAQKRYLITSDIGTKAAMDNAFYNLCAEEKKKPRPRTLNVLGHNITFSNTCGQVLYASFKELCERPLGSTDYIQIAKNFNTILIKNVPKMDLDSRNQARRFILLIDTLYDNKVRLMLSAADAPHNLFSGTTKKHDEFYTRVVMDDLNIEKGSDDAKASIFSGSEEIFAFDRTVSRIKEMCSESYWKRSKNY